MNEVQVYFVGMVLWWLTAPGPYVLIPELRADQHFALLTVAESSFVSGQCPPAFTADGDNCVFALNGNGAAGGVQISLLTNTPAGPFPEQAFCALPPLQRTTLYALLPKYRPPEGVGNAAWMSAIGGTPLSGVLDCKTPPNCPRFVQWSVPVTGPAHVTLVLDNLATRPPVLAPLKEGAQIVISNSPPDTDSPRLDHVHEDWCFYFRMITIVDGPMPQCPNPSTPPIPPPCQQQPSQPPIVVEATRFQTVACSNSQYP